MFLPELVEVKDKKPEYIFRYQTARGPEYQSNGWSPLWYSADGKILLSVSKLDSKFVLRFPGLADFIVSAVHKEICYYSYWDTPIETIRHLFLDQVLPLVLSLKGKQVFHASAILTSNGAIAFLGQAGWGKSTLAASFRQQGIPGLTDDLLLLEEKGGRPVCFPSYPGLRLWDDSILALFGYEPVPTTVAHYTTKKRLTLNDDHLNYFTEPLPLTRMYVLTDPETIEYPGAVTITPISTRDAFVELFKYTFRLDITNRKSITQEFERLSQLASLLPIYRLTYPRDMSFLPIVRKAILEDL
ncbi:MAG: hypothetical protein KDJ52_25920 [Anaerolineae bacterium]|nr:hypothetical protein [Anaerolineae bacterium]MCB0173567.1 hypothetical protein [Anaerolineae bacterium]MCB0212807.1 hypothetical protein [Anaerolineae bacterium]